MSLSPDLPTSNPSRIPFLPYFQTCWRSCPAPNCPLFTHLILLTDLAIETCQKSLHCQKMLPLLSQRQFVLLYNGETMDVWPRLGGSRPLARQPPPPPPPPPRPASDRPGARKPVPPRPAPICAFRKSRLPDSSGGSGAESEPSLCSGSPEDSRGATGEPSLEPSEEEREEEQRSASHRGS